MFNSEIEVVLPPERINKIIEKQKTRNPFGETFKRRFSKDEIYFIRRTVMKLPEDQFQVIYLYFWEELDKLDIGKTLNLSVSRVLEILKLALSALRTQYNLYFQKEIGIANQRGLSLVS